MPAANIEVNGIAASNTDLPINTLVQLSNADVGGETTYTWTIIDQPEGPADALSATAIENPTFTPKKEGTYLLQLVVNLGLTSEAVDRKVAAVRQFKSFLRVPAAQETIQADLVKGWKPHVNAALQRLDSVAGDSGVLACRNASGGTLTPGTIVRFVDESTIKTGLPGEERLLGVSAALATVATHVTGTLGVTVGAADGGSWTTAKVGLVRVRGLVESTAPGSPAVGTPVFAGSTGLPLANPNGSVYQRRIGRVVSVGGGTYRWAIDGSDADGATVEEVVQIHPFQAFDLSGFSFSSGYLLSTGACLARFPLALPVKSVLTGVAFFRFGDGVADITAARVFSFDSAGAEVQIAGITVTDPPASWIVSEVTPFAATEAASFKTFRLEIAGNAANLRVGSIQYRYTPRLGRFT